MKRDLRQRNLSREKVIAGAVRLLETTLIRIGNDQYARENQSYGLTTLRNRHAKVRGGRARFEFYGKSHQRHVIDLEDPLLARLVKRCQDLPGYELFQYLDEKGEPQKVTSDDVNEYLREITGQDFTAKDFRTWSGTVLAFLALQEFPDSISPANSKRNVKQAVEAVARMLGNTASVCRKCYIHPELIESYLRGNLFQTKESNAKVRRGFRPEDASVMRLLASLRKNRRSG